MKNFPVLLLVFVCISCFSATPKDKIKYIDTSKVADNMKIRIVDGISTDDQIKAKVLFENKNDFFVILDPTKSFFYINGTKFFSKDREIIIPPNGKNSKIIDSKGVNGQSNALSLVLEGLSKTGEEKTLSFPELKILNDAKSTFENIEILILDIDYDNSNKLNLKIKIKNVGSSVLIINPGVIELKDQENSLNNIRKRTSKLLLRKGESEVVYATFQTSGKGSEKIMIWNDGLMTTSIFPMSPIEIGMCADIQSLSVFKYFLPPTVEKKSHDVVKKEEPVAAHKTNTNKAPEKKTQAAKNDKQLTKEDTKKEDAKRSMDGDAELHASDVDFVDVGTKFYALLIGISDYTDPGIPDLDGLPISDALALEKVLTTYYTFNKEDVKVLKNPTRREIVIALDEIAKKANNSDNVLIFYAGHGHYEDDNDIGYWLPKDAEITNSANWLYNDQLVASIRKIKSLHTLLVSDACFSGSIFKSRSINLTNASDVIKKKYQLASRKAMTSGTLKTVPNKSVFMKYFLDRLEKNKSKYFSSSSLYQAIEQPVGNNSNSLPQFGVIQNVGDEGGDFIFIKK